MRDAEWALKAMSKHETEDRVQEAALRILAGLCANTDLAVHKDWAPVQVDRAFHFAEEFVRRCELREEYARAEEEGK